jgi:hypothetical protein
MNYEKQQQQEQPQNKEEMLLEQMKKFKDDYYKTNSTSIFFKSKQKQQYKESICNQFDVSLMIVNTIKVLPDSNIVFIDYEVFKLFANENIYDLIINYTIQIFDNFVKNEKRFNVQVNTKGLTISGIERYRGFIQLICMRCMDKQYNYFIDEVILYNTPNMIDSIISIIRPFLGIGIYEKIKISKG